MQYLLTEEEYKELTEQEKSSKLEELEEENKNLKKDLKILMSPQSAQISTSPSRPFSELLLLGYELEDLSERTKQYLLQVLRRKGQRNGTN